MKFKSLTPILSLCAALCLHTACTQDEDDATPGPITEVTNGAQYDALYTRLVELLCTCTQNDPIIRLLGSQCEEVLGYEVKDDRAEILDGLQNDRLEFNLEYYQCIERVLSDPAQCASNSESCGQEQLFKPKVELNGACLTSNECVSGYCMQEDESQCSLGVCVAEEEEEEQEVYVMEGEACGERDGVYYLCASDDITCNESLDEPVCVSIRNVANGQPCDNQVTWCSDGFCLPSDESLDSFVCKPVRQLNEECSSIELCDFLYYCEYTSRDMPGVCRQRIEAGGACTSPESDEYNEDSCVFGSDCINGSCYQRRFEGESCEIDDQCRGHNELRCQAGVCSKVCD